MAKDFQILMDEVMARPGAAERMARLREETDAEVEAYHVAELRAGLGLTQSEVAATLDISQSALSQMERADDVRVSTLRRIVEVGLGGRLSIAATFDVGDGRDVIVPIRLVDDAAAADRIDSQA